MVFIPQGSWHKVISKGNDIIAMNFWFDAISNQFKKNENYVLKYLLN